MDVFFYVWSMQFLNDLENDKKYKNWPNSVQDILRPTFPGMLRHVAKNIFHLVSITLVWISMYTVFHHAFSCVTLVKVYMVSSISLCSIIYTNMIPRDDSHNCARNTALSCLLLKRGIFYWSWKKIWQWAIQIFYPILKEHVGIGEEHFWYMNVHVYYP